MGNCTSLAGVNIFAHLPAENTGRTPQNGSGSSSPSPSNAASRSERMVDPRHATADQLRALLRQLVPTADISTQTPFDDSIRTKSLANVEGIFKKMDNQIPIGEGQNQAMANEIQKLSRIELPTGT
jgi:hypothetical protein